MPGGKRKGKSWMIDRIAVEAGLQADVCRNCLESQLNFVSLRSEETRDSRLQQLKQEQPDASPLNLLRQASRPLVGGVECDCCQTECLEKHLQIQSAWLENETITLNAEVCEACVNARFTPLVRFETVSANTFRVP